MACHEQNVWNGALPGYLNRNAIRDDIKQPITTHSLWLIGERNNANAG